MAAYTGVSKLGARSFDLLKLKHLRGYLPGTKIWGIPIEKNTVSICFHVIPTCQHFYLQLLAHLRRWSRANFASARVPGWTGHLSYMGVLWYRRVSSFRIKRYLSWIFHQLAFFWNEKWLNWANDTIYLIYQWHCQSFFCCRFWFNIRRIGGCHQCYPVPTLMIFVTPCLWGAMVSTRSSCCLTRL